jgi:hypothetical protein
MLQLHFFGVHHVLPTFKEFRSLRKFGNMVIKAVQNSRQFGQHKRLRLPQGSETPDFLKMAIELGASHCLRNPFTPAALMTGDNATAGQELAEIGAWSRPQH